MGGPRLQEATPRGRGEGGTSFRRVSFPPPPGRAEPRIPAGARGAGRPPSRGETGAPATPRWPGQGAFAPGVVSCAIAAGDPTHGPPGCVADSPSRPHGAPLHVE